MASVRKRTWENSKGEKKSAWAVDWKDSRGNRRRKHFATKKEADRERIKIEGQLAGGTYRPDADKYMVKDIAQSFLENCEGRMQRNERMTRKTFTVYKGHVNKHILNKKYGISQVKLSQLTAKRVGDFRDRMRNAGLGVVTTRKVLTTLHGILEYAISQDLVAANAAHGVKVIGPRDEGAEKVHAPSKEDLQSLLEVASEPLRQKIVFAASTGLRAGEQWAVRWGDINLTTGELNVSRRIDAYGEEGAPKTAAGHRVIPMSGSITAMLKKMKLASPYSRDEDFVFPNRKGSHTRHDNFIKRHFNQLFAPPEDCASHALEKFKWHALRHFAVSTWIEAGLAPKTVQTFAGHSSLQVTMDRYGHLFKSDDHKKAMDTIAKGLFS